MWFLTVEVVNNVILWVFGSNLCLLLIFLLHPFKWKCLRAVLTYSAPDWNFFWMRYTATNQVTDFTILWCPHILVWIPLYSPNVVLFSNWPQHCCFLIPQIDCYSEIMTQLNLFDNDVIRLLHFLSCAKYRILNKEPFKFSINLFCNKKAGNICLIKLTVTVKIKQNKLYFFWGEDCF